MNGPGKNTVDNNGRTRSQRFFHRVRRLLRFIWPDNCPICNRPLYRDESPVCLDCLSKIPRIDNDILMNYVGPPANSITLISWFIYSHYDDSHILIHHIKYHDRINLARKLGREFAMQKLTGRSNLPDLILPIPLHWTKFLKRGYSQTREIARGINDVTSIPVVGNLYARRSHPSQTSRSRLSRMENVRNIFDVRNPEQLNGKNIALIDDVVTTGSTMFSAVEAILNVCKPASITFLSLAKTHQI